MRQFFAIGIGGFLGAIARFLARSIESGYFIAGIPVNILAINISGCFILAFFLALALEIREVGDELKLAVTTGFLGSFTTFSTLSKEAVDMLSQGLYKHALLYLCLSAFLGLIFSFLGNAAGLYAAGAFKRGVTGKDEDNSAQIPESDCEVD